MSEVNKYQQAVETLAKQCGFSETQAEYEACCQKDGSQCSVESNPFSPEEPSGQEIAVLSGLILCVLITAFFAIKNGFHRKVLPPYRESTKASVVGWLIWCFCVFSYSQLFDTWLDFRLWFTLPPVCVIAIYYWYSKYVQQKP